ncbi:GGDEF domain-containing response regulator [Marinobacterium sp. D7]|uniref:EAL domain-containing protein n=1 Tax=Marinobacterium ramblicola TaxID=2849041 RepID=UPI001C2DB725|nr:EAL domain-containing protein [Marinobacterium ramblicola]MBV1786775.1 GGDEF domain-containing response regulator [Marinobacterium ramblicola]
MITASESAYGAFDRLAAGTHKRSTINIIFVGFESHEVDPLLSLIRTGRLSPRGRRIENREELSQILSQRSWDLLLCSTHTNPELNPQAVVQLLHHQDKDVPVIELSADTSEAAQLRAFKEGIQALLPERPGELLLHVVHQQLQALDTRRRLRQTETMLEITERHVHEQVVSSRSAIGYLHNAKLEFANDSLVELLGYERASQLQGTTLDQLLIPEQRGEVHEKLSAHFEQNEPVDLRLGLRIVRSDSSSFSAEVQLQTCRFLGHISLSMTIHPDNELFLDSAEHRDEDALTGLKNGTFLMQRLDETAQRALSGGHDAHLLYVRLDQYRHLLAELGGEAANTLLKSIASRLEKAFTEPHLVCRFEDDSFIVLFQHADAENAQKIGRKLFRQIGELKVPYEQSTLSSTCSVGIVTINDSSPPASELIQRAHKAADELVDGNGCALFHVQKPIHPQQDEDAIKRILNAITDSRLKMLFQPVVSLGEEEEVHEYEVLIRMLDHNDDALTPNIFLTEVEQSEVMVKMDRWVLERSLQLLREELDKGHRNRLFINIAGRTLRSRSLLTWFASQLEELHIPPDLLVFQISETDAATELEYAKQFADKVRAMECNLCIKHFGSSPNSHRVFAEVNANYLKLDGAYIQDLESGDLSIKALQEQLEPTLSHGLIVIAPLVENTRVISKLFRCGIQRIQGYYLQPPRETMDYDYFEER